MITPEQMLSMYNDHHAIPFNEKLFERDDNAICEQILRVIKKCERSKFFTIKLNSYQIIEDPEEVYNTLYNYEQARIDRSKQPDQENPYDYISIKDSDIKLMVINYIIGVKDKYSDLQVLIMVPRYVEKYCFRIQGNYYMPMFQIVDGSTYNNANTNAKNNTVTQKTVFTPIKIFRFHDTIQTVDGETLNIVLYSIIMNKLVPAFKYLLAKYGLIGTFELSKISCISVINNKPEPDDNYYVFEKSGIYLTVPKVIYNNDHLIQSLIHTIYHCIYKDTKYEDMFSVEYWISILDSSNHQYSREKGERSLESLEGSYDITTQECIRLPEEDKDNVYKIILWMIRHYSELMVKDNLDVSLKRVRHPDEYVASLYAMRLITGIHRISSHGHRAKIDTIRKAINIPPNYLLTQISKCSLVNYNNLVNEDDGMASIKMSYKGISGIGEKNVNNVSDNQRRIHPSNMGIIDTCSSGNSDPGMTGNLTPFCDIDEHGFFREFQEPNNWEEKFSKLMGEYKSITGMKEVAIFKNRVLGVDNSDEIQMLQESEDITQELIQIVTFIEETSDFIDGTILD